MVSKDTVSLPGCDSVLQLVALISEVILMKASPWFWATSACCGKSTLHCQSHLTSCKVSGSDCYQLQSLNSIAIQTDKKVTFSMKDFASFLFHQPNWRMCLNTILNKLSGKRVSPSTSHFHVRSACICYEWSISITIF